MPDSLQAWLSRLETLHPTAIDLGLERSRQVAERLGLLPFPARIISVAGTNGKGTVTTCAAALGSACGWRTGAYTSPHLLRFNERIAIDGKCVTDTQIVRMFEQIDTARETISLSYFEFATLAALLLFREAQVELAVLEVGLGGRLDAVNIIDADVAVITAIGLDHQEWLGDTLEAIAVEKAGIARASQTVVLAEPRYPDSLLPVLAAVGAQPLRAGVHWHWRGAEQQSQLELQLPDGARWQLALPQGLLAANVAAATMAVQTLAGSALTESSVVATLAALRVPGRQQYVQIEGVPVVLDVAHNPDSAQSLARMLRASEWAGVTHGICGILADKDAAGILGPLLPLLGSLTLCGLPTPRSADPQALLAQLPHTTCSVSTVADVASAWSVVLSQLLPGDRVVIFGSFYTVAAMMQVAAESASEGAEEVARISAHDGEGVCSSNG